MLRSKGLSEKVILLGIDGMDPKFSRKMVDEGYMPNLKKLIEKGAARHDLRLLGGVPTITPPMWTTLATGAYPMTHGIEDFNIGLKGELDVNFAGIYSKYVKAQQLWNVTAESGKKTLVWHWPGGAWPPSSDSENLYVVDGTTPGALGFGYAMRDWEGILIADAEVPAPNFYYGQIADTRDLKGTPEEMAARKAETNYNSYTKSQNDLSHVDELWNEFKDGIEGFNGFTLQKAMDVRTNLIFEDDKQMYNLHRYKANVAVSPVSEPTGWEVEIPEGAKEFTWLQLFGKMPRPCLILKNEAGVYDRVAIYAAKNVPQPLAVIEKDVYTPNVYDVVPTRQGTLENVVRNIRILDLAEDGSHIRMWFSNGFSADDNRVWYPTWIFDKIRANFGPPCATGQLGDSDVEIMNKCNLEQWRQAAKWQADSINYMIKEEGVDVVFSHFHGPDMSGHTYMRILKDRETSKTTEEEIYKCAIGTHVMTDEYIGEFLPLLDEGWTILLFSDHSLVCPNEDYTPGMGDNYAINTKTLVDLGYTVMQKDENGKDIPAIDWEKTVAIQQRSNSIYINLKGRDRFGIVDPADKYELEEKIITDLYGIKDPKTGHRVVSLALHRKDANLLGLGGEETGADIVFFIHDDFLRDHGEGLSTAEGYADTTLSPIFVAAGAGIKEGFEMELFPREVDVAPTAAVLLGVSIPAQCEGAPIYSIFSEEV
ncbi:MAG: alkaline phosphatase family protein [Peptococcaceae bacterium]|nr:alkaline phosphatase family protein [Peptococcaceae bacterium]